MSEVRGCLNCGKPTPWGHNYCPGPECSIEHAKKQGGTVHCPNGLPIRCIKHDTTMWEHEAPPSIGERWNCNWRS